MDNKTWRSYFGPTSESMDEETAGILWRSFWTDPEHSEDAFSVDGLNLIRKLRTHLSDEVIAKLKFSHIQQGTGSDPRILRDESGNELGRLPAFLAEIARGWWCGRRKPRPTDTPEMEDLIFIRSETLAPLTAAAIREAASAN
jgi:hypothetical protein